MFISIAYFNLWNAKWVLAIKRCHKESHYSSCNIFFVIKIHKIAYIVFQRSPNVPFNSKCWLVYISQHCREITKLWTAAVSFRFQKYKNNLNCKFNSPLSSVKKMIRIPCINYVLIINLCPQYVSIMSHR